MYLRPGVISRTCHRFEAEFLVGLSGRWHRAYNVTRGNLDWRSNTLVSKSIKIHSIQVESEISQEREL
jgi:hypothetical protein